jgi:hypothetical protein
VSDGEAAHVAWEHARALFERVLAEHEGRLGPPPDPHSKLWRPLPAGLSPSC